MRRFVGIATTAGVVLLTLALAVQTAAFPPSQPSKVDQTDFRPVPMPASLPPVDDAIDQDLGVDHLRAEVPKVPRVTDAQDPHVISGLVDVPDAPPPSPAPSVRPSVAYVPPQAPKRKYPAAVTRARQYALDRLGAKQFRCLDALFYRESRWSTTATNKRSGAYGIPQALPGSKMAKAGPDWRTNPVTQVKWGLMYISGRYGTACKALQHAYSTGWY